MRSFVVFLTLVLFVFPVFAHGQINWQISDYLENLPDKYKTFEGDFVSLPPGPDSTIIDNLNGYAAFMDSPGEDGYSIFEIAMFKPKTGPPVLVVSNLQSDPVCSFYETFFLEVRGDQWIDVKSRVLPELGDSMFFESPELAEKHQQFQDKYKGQGVPDFGIHFSPPRHGTKLKVSTEVCDYVDDGVSDDAEINEYLELLGKTRPIFLQWNADRAVFTVEK